MRSGLEKSSAVFQNKHIRSCTRADGFTLLELLVVLGILALLTTIVYPQVTRYVGTARTETARAQIGALVTAVELYALDNGTYPASSQGLAVLVQKPANANRWNGPYLKSGSGLVDPWGNHYQYNRPGRSGPFEIFSLGRDNVPGGVAEDQDLIGG